jgi:hypothetical protein
LLTEKVLLVAREFSVHADFDITAKYLVEIIPGRVAIEFFHSCPFCRQEEYFHLSM